MWKQITQSDDIPLIVDWLETCLTFGHKLGQKIFEEGATNIKTQFSVLCISFSTRLLPD